MISASIRSLPDCAMKRLKTHASGLETGWIVLECSQKEGLPVPAVGRDTSELGCFCCSELIRDARRGRNGTGP